MTGRSGVAIVGGGPVGLSLALLLARQGVRSTVFERRPIPTSQPAAHFISARTMEILRSYSRELEASIARHCPPLADWSHFVYGTSLTKGTVFGNVNHFPESTQATSDSPCTVQHVSQSKVVPELVEYVKREPYIELVTSSTVTGVAESAEAVTVTVQPEGGGPPTRRTFDCVVGADGAHSAVRRALAIDMVGTGDMQHVLNVHFACPSLAKHVMHRAMLYFVFNAHVTGVVVAHSLADGDYVCQIPFHPPLQTLEDYTPAVCRQLLTAAIGAPLPDLRVQSVRAWTMAARVATRYTSPARRVFLAGDAAHHIPPSGGFGMNTGIQDAHNLAWKLAMVERGQASDRLLETYDQERRAVGAANAKLSQNNFHRTVEVANTLGLRADLASVALAAATRGPAALLPLAARKKLFEAAMTAGRAQVPLVERVPALLENVRRTVKASTSLRLLYPGQDLGMAYTAGALDFSGGARPLPPNPFTYEPRVAVGCRVPHVWMDPGPSERMSTHDVVAAAGATRLKPFVLFAAASDAGTWRESLTTLPVSLQPVSHDAAVAALGLSEKAALLVRPDGYVAWRGGREAVASLDGVMKDLLRL